MPSGQSLQKSEYYGNSRNQFWKIICSIFDEAFPSCYEDKVKLLAKNRVALWDVLKECDRIKSSDATIGNGAFNDIPTLLNKYPQVTRIVLNGKKAKACFENIFGAVMKIPYVYVPSSSSANARISLHEKICKWKRAIRWVS